MCVGQLNIKLTTKVFIEDFKEVIKHFRSISHE